MPYSCIHNGQVLDFKYVPHNDGQSLFYIGDILVGIVSKQYHRKWNAIALGLEENLIGMRMVSGFATRHDASAYLLTVQGYWKDYFD